ncbi:MAG: hypothetical protein ACM3MG_01565 [Bacillota bacterium]
MRKIAVCLIFALISLKALADIQPGRINALLNLSGQYRQDGANCFASVAFSSGLIDDASYVTSGFFEALTATPYCQNISSEKVLKKGDFIVIGDSKHNDVGRWIHTLLALEHGQGFAKMGYKKEDKTMVTDLRKNVLWYLSQDPSMKTTQFRCDFSGLRMAIEQSDLVTSWNDLLSIRKDLFAELTHEAVRNHDAIVLKLDHIETTISHSKAPQQLKEVVRNLLFSAREQLQLTDIFAVEM